MGNAISWIKRKIGSLSGISSNYVVRTTIAGWGSRIFISACQLLQVRLLSYHLGIDNYAAYTIITGLAGWFALSDFGFGRPLQNRISELRLAGEDYAPVVMSTAVFVAFGGAAIILLLLLLSGLIGPFLLRKLSTVAQHQAMLAFAVYSVMGVALAVSSLIYRVLFAEHEGYWVYAMNAASALVVVIGIYILSFVGHFSLVLALITAVLPTVLFPAAALGVRLTSICRSAPLEGIRRYINVEEVKKVGVIAKHFLWCSLAAVSVNNIDVIVISQYFNSRDIVLYSVSLKLYGLIFVLLNNFMQASYPEFTELLLKGDRRRLLRLIAVCLGLGSVTIAMGSFVLMMFPHTVMDLILPAQNVQLTLSVIAVFSFYWLVRVWCDSFATLVQSSSNMKYFSLVATVQALLNAILMIGGARYYGLVGMVLGSAFSFVLTVGWSLPTQGYFMLRALKPSRQVLEN